jgi:hypothetical protein
VPGGGGAPDADQWVHVFLCSPGLLGGRAAYTWATGRWRWRGRAFGSLIGGIAVVTSIRLLQTPHRIAEERTQR